jgi:mannose-6-phosphate isomerase
MSDLYPLRILPEFHERVWGSHDLSPLYRHPGSAQPIGEVWLTGDNCRVANGPLAGQTLRDITAQYARQLVGSAAAEPSRFPLLVKFLFPQEKLSVQVHPDDEGARRVGQSCGKTECWYVVAAKPGAQVGLGMRPGTTPEEFERAIQENRAELLLNWLPIQKGETIYVDAGTVHTIGPGSILLETQQNSDTTYRLYDYGRPRELHIREGLATMKEQTRAGKVRPDPERPEYVVSSPCFVIDKLRLEKRQTWAGANTPEWESVHILVAINGCGVVESAEHEPVTFAQGETVVVPAVINRFTVRPQFEVEFIAAVVPPPGAFTQPDTTMEDAVVVAST